MITRIEEWLEGLLESRRFQWLLLGSVAYAAAWLYVLPRSGVFDLVLWLAVGLWAGVLAVMLFAILLAIGRGIREHFLPWDGQDRRWRERRSH